MTLSAVIHWIGVFCGIVLLGYGIWFLIAPMAALNGTYHRSETLPFVMAGRYFFFGTLLICALMYGDRVVLSFLLAGFAGLGMFDAVLYADSAPLPHLLVGVLAGAASFYVFKNRKVAH